MATEQDNDGPAFPSNYVSVADGSQWTAQGMTLRDYFAAKAFPSVYDAYLQQNRCGCAEEHALRNVAGLAYKYADAMLKERAK